MKTLPAIFLLFALLLVNPVPTFSQIVDPDPPFACTEDSDGGSYIEFSGTFQSPEGMVKGRIDWRDVKDWIDSLLDLFGGGGGGGQTPPDGGEPPSAGETPTGEETPPDETPPGGEETPPGEGTPPEGNGEGGNTEEQKSGAEAACSRVLQAEYYANVDINPQRLLVTMARPNALNIVRVHTARPIAIPVRFTRQAGMEGRWFIPAGTYTPRGPTINLPLRQRKSP
ncbi:MAG: hypothetical protein ACOCTG_04020 [Bacteroidota bacterium]